MTADRPPSDGLVVGADLTLLVTSPRIAPGLLSRAAWAVVDRAGTVLCSEPDDLQPAALAEAGVVVQQAHDSDPPALAHALVEAAQRSPVVWVGSPDGDPGLTDALAAELSRVAALDEPPSVEVLVGSHDVAGARLLDLVAVMDRLRSPGGCPWDAAQSHTSLVPYLVEEAFEAVEAIETGDRAAMREELGDVLLQVMFHARVAQEHPDDPFDVDDVAAGIVSKLVHRHPHVFGVDAGRPAGGDDGPDVTAESVEVSWEVLKAAEKARESVLDGVPVALPALARADKVLGRLERAGLEVDLSGVDSGVSGAPALGEQLLQLVREARARGVDPEAVLRDRVRELEERARQAEAAR